MVHVAYEDAEAYARWAGKRLPTEAQFEFAARGGLTGKRYAWGDELQPQQRWMANTFQGHFPERDSGSDGWTGVAPVASYPPSTLTGSLMLPATSGSGVATGIARTPTRSSGRAGALRGTRPARRRATIPTSRASRSGSSEAASFLCSTTFCTRYLVGARGKDEISTGTNHLGFRCARSPGDAPVVHAAR